MDGIYQAWQTGLVWVCLCALGAMAVLLFLAKVAAPAWDAVRRWWSLPCIQRVIVGVCVVGLSYYGATKQGWHVAYDGGIKAGATANVVTNDTVSIHWQRDTSGGVYVPATATVYIDAIEHGSSNVVNIAQTTVGAWGWSGTVENATNYDYNAWAYYIPPEPVHTNGVWTYKTHFDRNGEYALPLRARVEVNGVAIATPAEKRKDAEKLPYDAEVEYLESTGTQWIDTGIVHDQTFRWECDAKFTSIGSANRYIGQTYKTTAGGGAPRSAFGVGAAGYWYVGLGNRNSPALATADTDRHVFVLDARQKTFQIDASTYAVNWSSFSLPTYVGCGLGLFGRSLLDTDGEVIPFCLMRIYSSKHYQDGTLVRDFIPVRVGTTGALYDKRGVGGMNGDGTARNDGLYFNRGTGNFGYGNDK